jgi:hypothetical protein
MTFIKQFGKYFLTLLICLFLFACSKITQDNFEKIKTDMAMKEVIAILGEPTASQAINIAGISGTSAMWKDKNGEIDIQFLDDKVAVKSFSKINDNKTEQKL